VADNFLRRWFAGSKGVPPSVAEAQAEVDRALSERPTLEGPLLWLRDLLPNLCLKTELATPDLSLEHARAKLAAGLPLLKNEKVNVDQEDCRRRWLEACRALEARQKDGAAAALANAMKKGQLDFSLMIETVLAGRPEVIQAHVESFSLDATLASTILRFVLFPTFCGFDMALSPLREGIDWRQGYCPTCGSWPLLGEFRGLDQTRYLRCGVCAAGWEVDRQWCSYCGNRDHETLQFLHQEGEEAKYRAAICDECRGYVKMLSTLSALPPMHLLIADTITMHLDLAAAERGYSNAPAAE
jgi:FdhE protein